jgi:hypothetical protein
VAEPGSGTYRSDSKTFGPNPGRVIRYIESFYSGEGAGPKQERRRNPHPTLSGVMAEKHGRWRPNDPSAETGAWSVKWIMPGGQAIGGDGAHDAFKVPDALSTADDTEADLLSHGAVKVKMATYDAIDPLVMEMRKALTERQRHTLRHLISSTGTTMIHATLRPRPESDRSGEVVKGESIEDLISRSEDFYDRRMNPAHTQPDSGAYVLAVGEDEDANLQLYNPDSQRLVEMSPSKYLKHARRYFESQPDTTWSEARRAITTDAPSVSEQRVEKMMNRMKNEKPIDALFFDVRLNHDGPGSPIIGQEGRHRAIAADRLGLLHVPVVLYGHLRKEDAGMFGGAADVKVGVEGREFPSSLMAGANVLPWPDESTPVHDLWQEHRFGMG